MTTTTTVHAVKVEDREGNGICSACDRESLRWIVTLSDGSQVGIECAKKACGWKPAPKAYQWAADYFAIVQRDECGDAWVLWQSKTRFADTRTTRNGLLVAVGGQRATWIKRGWLAA